MSAADAPTHLLVPIKRLALAKSRVAVEPAVRSALALAMALDTVAVARAAREVAQVWIVSSDLEVRAAMATWDVGFIDEPTVDPDEPEPLNAALRTGLQSLARAVPCSPTAIVPADLPALRSEHLDAVLVSCRGHDRGLVADYSGEGTTLLWGRTASHVKPSFGQHSLARHLAQGAVMVQAADDVRLDVDTLDDLAAARRLGVGPNTSELA